jgi:hypothetical protein
MPRSIGAKGTDADRDLDEAVHARANGRKRRCHRGLRLAAALALALRPGCRAAHCSARALRAAASTEPSRSRCRRRERARFELAGGLPEPLIENYHARSILLVRSGEQAPGWIAGDTIAVSGFSFGMEFYLRMRTDGDAPWGAKWNRANGSSSSDRSSNRVIVSPEPHGTPGRANQDDCGHSI